MAFGSSRFLDGVALVAQPVGYVCCGSVRNSANLQSQLAVGKLRQIVGSMFGVVGRPAGWYKYVWQFDSRQGRCNDPSCSFRWRDVRDYDETGPPLDYS